jgi:TolB-like protein/DNA-binding winged helix-turn-helix (wHTH) protein
LNQSARSFVNRQQVISMGRSGSSMIFGFGPFEADVRAGELRKNGTKVPLQEQPFQVLAVLLERPGELVRRDELRQRVWPRDTFVEFDHALNTAVKKIRSALGDDANAPRYIETIPKRGYRFVAPVTTGNLQAPQLEGNLDNAPRARARRWLPRATAGAALAVTVLVSVSLLGMRWRSSSHDSRDKRVVLAVLPFEDWSDNSRQTYLCDGISQELITQLGRVETTRLVVTPRAASLQYRHTTKTVAEVAHELHAEYLVEGNVRGDARHVRVTVEVIRVRDETRVWGDDFDRDVGDSLALESEVAASITAKLRTALFPGGSPGR